MSVATWPPAFKIFLSLLERGTMDDSRRLADAPEDVRSNKRYAEIGAFSITALAQRLDRPARPSRSTSNPRIKFPSAERSGIKIRLKGPLTVDDSTTQTLLVDSDLGSSFHDAGPRRGTAGALFPWAQLRAIRSTCPQAPARLLPEPD